MTLLEHTMEFAPIDRNADPLRVGIVGFGKVGQTRARCLATLKGVSLEHVCDVNPACGALVRDKRFSTDYREVIDDPAVDAVFVSTFNNVAPDVVVAALHAGKHVFCEKPPGRSVSDIKRIILAEQSNPDCKLQFGFNHRHHYAVMEAKTMIESGHLGQILWMRGVYGKAGSEDFTRLWRSSPEIAGGGILLDQGIHMLDLFRHFCGDFTDVRSLVRTMYWDIPLEDNAFAILSNERGQTALLHSSATQWKHRFSLEICLQNGYVNINGILSSTRSYGDESLTYARRPEPGTGGIIGCPREEVILFDTDDSWVFEIKDFLRSITENQPVRWGTSADALRAMELVEAIYRNGQ